MRLTQWNLVFSSRMAYAGLACGVAYSFGGMVIDLRTTGLNGGTVLAFMALVGMPVVFGTVGLIASLLAEIMVGLVRKCINLCSGLL